MNGWPQAKLDDVLVQRKPFITIDDSQRYKRPRVQLHAKGIVLRDQVVGADIRTKKQQVCNHGDFLVAEIDAKVGGFGIVPPELEGAIVSSHYFLFETLPDRLGRDFLGYACRSRAFISQVAAKGSTNYAAIRPADVLGYEIPLPPLAEQRIIVTRLDALADKTRQLTAHLDAIEAAADQLLAQHFQKAIADAPYRPMAEAAPQVKREVEIELDTDYTELGVRSFYKGTFHRRTIPGADFTWQKIFRIHEGDLVFSNIMAWEQAIAIATSEDDNCVGNHRMLTCEANPDIALPAFLAYYFKTEAGFAKVYAASPGTAARNRTLQAKNLAAIDVPTPSLPAQRAFVTLQAKVNDVKTRHARIRAANADLLPATLERLFSDDSRHD